MNVLENLISQATSPTNQHYNSDTLKVIVELINKEPNGPAVALRLLAHKIQSPQEREALCALTILEGLTKQCDRPFISELGKFKFINEIIKVLSPKHLGDQTTETVKAKCRKLLFEWQRDHGAVEPKFTAAYTMLCSQGLIPPDPTTSSNGEQRTNSTAGMGDASRRTDIFDRNRHSERLTKLLRSRNPNDIAEANRIIKSIVEEDQQRMEKETRRTTEMESLKNNTLLLNEMTANYIRSGASKAELELMSELVDNIGKARPLLYSFSLTHDENDIMTLTEIARICEQATSALEFYAEKVTKSAAHETPSVTNISGPDGSDSPGLDLGNLAPESRTITPDNQTAGVDDLLSRDLFELGLSDVGPAVGAVPQPPIDLNPTEKPASHTRYDELEDIFSKLIDKTPVSASTNQISPIKATSVPGVTKTPSNLVSQPCYHPSVFLSSSSTDPVSDSPTKTQLFDELDALGRQMLGFDTSTTSGKPSLTAGYASFKANKHPSANGSPNHIAPQQAGQSQINGTADIPGATAACVTLSEPSTAHLSATSTIPTCAVDLSGLDVQLSAIEPHPGIRDPVRLYPKDSTELSSHNVLLDLHYAANRPATDVSVFVAVVLNRSSLPVSELIMRFAVNKPLQLRNLTASGQSLSAYSPFLPAGAINQVILIYDPLHRPTFQLKFQLSFNLGDEAILESGSLTIPSA